MIASMSSSTALSVLPSLVVMLAVGGLGYAFWRSYKRRQEAWSAFAARHGWRYTHAWSSLEVRGRFLQRGVLLRTESRGSGKSRHTVTVLQVGLGDTVPRALRLEPESLGDKFLKLFGSRDEELGDKELDTALDLKHVSPEARSILLAPRVRRALLAMHRHSYSRFSIQSSLLTAEQGGVPETLDALEQLMTPARNLAEALEWVFTHPEERIRG